MATTPLTDDQIAQAEVQLAAKKVAGVQPLIDALNGTSGTTLKTVASAALAVLTPADALYQTVSALNGILISGPTSLSTKLAPLAQLAASSGS